jgi:hypothetical protein
MIGQIVRSLAAVLLSLTLLYSGAASAIRHCLHDGNGGNHAPSEAHHHRGPASDHSERSHHSLPFFHCTSFSHAVGPGAVMTFTPTFLQGKGAPLQSLSNFLPTRSSAGSGLWLNALFKRFLAFPWSHDFARYLALSILQI